MFSNGQLQEIFLKTTGHCHFCGDRLRLERYGENKWHDQEGTWEADHVIQRGKGGSNLAENCLPTCVRCNRLRWHRKGKELTELLFLGLIAKVEVKKRTAIGKTILRLRALRLERNRARRRQDLGAKTSLEAPSKDR